MMAVDQRHATGRLFVLLPLRVHRNRAHHEPREPVAKISIISIDSAPAKDIFYICLLETLQKFPNRYLNVIVSDRLSR